MKAMNHTGLWDAKLTWYSPSATFQICLDGLERGLKIHGFRSTLSYLIVMLLTIQAEFFFTIWLLYCGN